MVEFREYCSGNFEGHIGNSLPGDCHCTQEKNQFGVYVVSDYVKQDGP